MALTTGLLAYYKLDSDAKDSTANGEDGTVNGATASTSGKINGCYSFDGSNDYIATPNEYTSDFTWSAWINSDVSDGYNNVISLIRTGNTNYRIALQRYVDNTIVVAYDDNSEVGLISGSISNAMSVNTWYFVTITKSGENWVLYLNASSISTKTTTSFNMTILTDTVTIGRYNTGSTYFSGKIDEIGIWNRALTSSEVTELYNSGNGLQYPFSAVTAVEDPLFLGGGL